MLSNFPSCRGKCSCAYGFRLTGRLLPCSTNPYMYNTIMMHSSNWDLFSSVGDRADTMTKDGNYSYSTDRCANDVRYCD